MGISGNYKKEKLWKQLLKLRHEALRFVKGILGDGKEISFWFDNWSPLGQLISYFGSNGPRELRVPINAKVANVCEEYGWRLPSPRSDQALNLQVHLSTVQVPHVNSPKDHYEWVVDGFNSSTYSSSSIRVALRPRDVKKQWVDLIWFKGFIPKHAFTMWVANYDRLPTRSRMAVWGMPVSKDCCLCSVREETRDHLFLTCDYSHEIWRLACLI